jgi:hypothetical protein
MAAYTGKLAKVAGPVLAPGEQLQAGARGMRWGFTKELASHAARGVVGGAVAAAIPGSAEDGAEQAARAGLPDLPPQLALGLTDRRLLVFKRSAMSGKAKELVGELARDRIRHVEAIASDSKLRPDRLGVQLDDGEAVWFEVVRGDGAQAIADAFASGPPTG